MKGKYWLGIIGMVLLLGAAGCKEHKQPVTKQNGNNVAQKKAPVKNVKKAPEQVKVEFFVMSKCPFGAQVVKAIQPVLKKLGNAVDFHVYYIGNINGDQLTSMHGPKEVQGDKLSVCAMKYAPEKWPQLLGCMAKSFFKIPDNFSECINQVGLSSVKDKIQKCANGKEGTDLLKKSFQVSQQRGAHGSPTMYIGGARYSGSRSEKGFLRAICSHYKNWKPEECKKLPPPVEVTLTLLNDKRCKKCRTAGLVSRLRSMFPKLTVKQIDYNTPEGKKLYDEISKAGIKYLPAYLFDQNIKKSDSYANLSRWLVPAGKYLSLRVGSKFDPTKEICDNGIDDDKNGKTDCDDPYCKNTLTCRKEIKKKLEVFIMSHCPFGIMAVNNMKEVLKALGKDINFEIHYIATDLGNGKFRSLHGPKEVTDDILELCAKKYYGKNNKYLDYIWCRNKNIRDTDWKKCAKEAGLDVKKLEKCLNSDEGKKLLSEDVKIANGLGIGASPTWMVNNKFKIWGRTPEDIKNQYCKYNPGLKGCKAKLTNKAKAPAGSCR